jgi:hypothetical protein
VIMNAESRNELVMRNAECRNDRVMPNASLGISLC